MMSRDFGLRSELGGAIAKRLPHAKNQLSVPGSFFNQFVTDIYIYIYIFSSVKASEFVYISRSPQCDPANTKCSSRGTQVREARL